MKLDFQFGKKETSMATWVKLTLAIKGGIPFLARLLRVKEQSLYTLLDEIVRKYFPQSVVNEFIIKDDELLSQRVDRDVDQAIADFTSSSTTNTIEEPIYYEVKPDESDAQSLLGGEIGVTANWARNNQTNEQQNLP